MMAVTRKDIAEQAGVSSSTVGMILGGRGAQYSETTREKVQAVATQLNYRPDMAARALKMNRSFLIGVLLNARNKNFAMDFLRGLQDALGQSDCSPIVFSHDNVEEEMASLRKCRDRRVDGLIVNFTFDEESADPLVLKRLLALRHEDFPIVEVFGRFMSGVATVNIDNEAAGRDAVSHLIGLGHRRIVMLTHEFYDKVKEDGVRFHFDAWQQYVGYKRAMQTAGLEPVIMTHALEGTGGLDPRFFRGGEESLEPILDHESQPTAVVCYSDHQAYGLVRTARRLGIAIPEQLSIIGFGNHDLSEITGPTLSTLALPAWQIGRTATEMLLRRIKPNADAPDAVTPDVLHRSNLIARESTAHQMGVSQ